MRLLDVLKVDLMLLPEPASIVRCLIWLSR